MPRKNNAKYQKKFCKNLWEHFTEGGSVDSIPDHLEKHFGIIVSRATIYNWIKQYPEFALAVDFAMVKAQKHLERLLWIAAHGKAPEESKGINVKAVEFALKTRFHKTYSTKKRPEAEDQTGDNRIVIVRAEDADQAL